MITNCYYSTYNRTVVLRNITINIPDHDFVGVIGKASFPCIIQNLKIDNIFISGQNYVGGLAASSTGTIKNCHLQGIVSGNEVVGGVVGSNSWAGFYDRLGTITACGAAVTVNGTNSTGGLVGTNYSAIITSCYAKGDVTGTGGVGGLIGMSQSSQIWNCYAMGTVSGSNMVGGLIGNYSSNNLTMCYSNGKVNGSGSSVGGLIGGSSSGVSSESCFWDKNSSGITVSAGGLGKTTLEMKTLSTYTNAEWDFIGANDNWGDWIMPQNGYPRLAWEVYPMVFVPDLKGMMEADARMMTMNLGIVPGDSYEVFDSSMSVGQVNLSRPVSGSGVFSGFTKVDLFIVRDRRFSGGRGLPADPYHIATPGDWLDLIGNPVDWDKSFVLTADIDLAKMDLTPVGTNANRFSGNLNGVKYRIRNAMFEKSGTPNIGLFRYVGNTGKVCDLGLDAIWISGSYNIGSLASNNYGNLVSCYATGTVWGTDTIGGLVGYNAGTISNCRSECNVTSQASTLNQTGGLVGKNDGAIIKCNATGDVRGNLNVGGLTGSNQGSILYSYATGNVTSLNNSIGGLAGSNGVNGPEGTIASCYATGTVQGKSYVGGLVGRVGSGTVRTSFATGKVDGSSDVGGLVGNSSIGLTITSCYWDIDTSGRMNSAGGTGKITTEMKQKDTFVGWDFVGERSDGDEDIWRMCVDGKDYPQLSWQYSTRGDLDCMDGVEMQDLLYLSTRWMAMTTSDIGAADGNGDARVDFGDFSILAEHWGTDPSFLGYWMLDGDYSDSTNGYTGSPVGDPAFVDSSQAKVGSGAVELDGNDYVVVNGFAGITGITARTCTAWIKTTSTVAPILYWGDKNTAGRLWDIRVNSLGQLKLQVGGGPGISSVSTVNTGQWVHVAVVLPEGGNNTDDVLLYINGIRETGGALTAGTINTVSGVSVRIGTDEAGRYFTGLIDDVRIYDRALTAEEIEELAML